MLHGKLTHGSLRELIGQRFAAHERFRCRPVSDTLTARWVEVEDFDLEDHVINVALPAPAAQEQLEALAGELAASPFNATRPWWTFHLVEKYGSGSAVIARIHHCYADGIALIRVLLSMADDGSAVPEPPATPPPDADPQGTSLLGSLYDPIANLVTSTLREGAQLIAQGVNYTFNPGKALDAAADAAGLLGDLTQLGMLPSDPSTRLKGPLSGARRVAWAPPLAFKEVRTVAQVLGCTINDVLMATLAGALGKYFEDHGDPPPERALHATVPVNLRPADQASDALGNRFGLVFVELPVGITHPLERVYAVHDAMKALKGSSAALVTFGLLAAVGAMPSAIEEKAIDLFTSKASLVVSNVPGPRTTIRIGGVPVEQMLFWVPQAGSIGMGVSMLSYNNQVQFGVISDRQLVPDPHRLVAHVATEFERLALLVLMADPTGRGVTAPQAPGR
jgi:WS/DGAT/MGAT family acyltransferase